MHFGLLVSTLLMLVNAFEHFQKPDCPLDVRFSLVTRQKIHVRPHVVTHLDEIHDFVAQKFTHGEYLRVIQVLLLFGGESRICHGYFQI